MILPPPLHDWALTPAEARQLQTDLAGRVELTDRLPTPIQRVAGVDVGFEQGGRITRAAIAVLDAETLEPLEFSLARQHTRMPYAPGLLSFRECPAILEALTSLRRAPELLLCDGHGTAHPRGLGIASHLGLATDLPAIGVAKSRLTGRHGPVPEQRGAWTGLWRGDRVIGAVLRTRVGVRPLFIPPGHRLSLATALPWVMRRSEERRVPETTRWADGLASSRPWCRRALADRALPMVLTGPTSSSSS